MSGRAGRRRQLALAILVGLALVALYGYRLAGTWSDLSTQDSTLGAERVGVSYAQPVVNLIAVLTAQQVARTTGRPADTAAVSAAAHDVAAADATDGAALGTTGRWTDLQSRVGALTAAGAAASYATAIRLADTTLVAAANAAGLDRDSRTPELATAAVTTLPAVMTYAATTWTSPDEPAALAVARYQVALGVESVGTALPSAATMSPDLTRAFDDFQAAATLVAPTALVGQLTTPAIAPSADDLTRLVTASATLDQAILATLDHGLADRADTVRVDERIVLAEAGAAGLGLLALLWLLSPRRDDGDDPGSAGDSDSAAAPAPPQIALIGAEELLGVDELIHIGRAVRPRRRESDDAE